MSVVELPEATVSKRLDRTDWTTIAAIGGVVLALHLFGWGVLVLGVAPAGSLVVPFVGEETVFRVMG